MASCKTINIGSNKKMLKDVTQLLGFCEPLYGTLNGNSHVACVISFTSNGGMPYFRVGHVSMSLIASEESAAEHCLQTLVNDFDLCIEPKNTDKCEQCEQCEKYFLLSSTKSTVEGKDYVALMSETLSHASEEECLTSTDLASQIRRCTLPPPLKKRRVNWFPVLVPVLLNSFSCHLISQICFLRKKVGIDSHYLVLLLCEHMSSLRVLLFPFSSNSGRLMQSMLLCCQLIRKYLLYQAYVA